MIDFATVFFTFKKKTNKTIFHLLIFFCFLEKKNFFIFENFKKKMSKNFEDWKEEALEKCRLMESTVLDMMPGEKLVFVVLSREPFERFDSFGEFKEKWVIMNMTETTFEKTGAVGTTDGSVKIDFFAPNARLDTLMELADSRSYIIIVK